MIDLERNAPDLEDLAAYLDGRLSGEQRASVEERLLRDEDYYEVFLETRRTLEEQSQTDASDNVIAPGVWWRSWRTMVPLSIAATVVLALGAWQLTVGPSTERLVARLDLAAIVASSDWNSPGWQVSRGGSSTTPDPNLRRRQELAFRIGTRTVDLGVALAANDEKAAKLAAAQIDQWSTDTESLVFQSKLYADLRDRIADDEPPDALVAQAAALQESLEELLEHYDDERQHYDLGRWNEIGRLAALSGNSKVLTGIWRRRRIAAGIKKIEPHLETLEAVLSRRSLSAEDYDQAAKAFSDIADTLAGRG